VRRCPASQASAESFAVVRAASGWGEGTYPVEGGWAQQSGKLDVLVSLVHSERTLIEQGKQRE
jgi:hypothetical protein